MSNLRIEPGGSHSGALLQGTAMKSSRHTTRRPAARWAIMLVHLLPWLAVPTPAQAYLDPGTGSTLLQVIIGGVAGLGVIAKLYWHRLRGLLGLDKKRPQEERPPAVE